MKKTLLHLLLSTSALFGNTIIGTWAIDEKNTKASLKSSSLTENELVFMQRFVLHTMKSLQCSKNHTCLIPGIHSSNPHSGKYSWSQRGKEYILESNHNQSIIIPIDATTIRMVMSNISEKKLEIYYKKNSDAPVKIAQQTVATITPLKTIEVTKKVIDTITTSIKSPTKNKKTSTDKTHSIPKQKLPTKKEHIIHINSEKEKAEKNVDLRKHI